MTLAHQLGLGPNPPEAPPIASIPAVARAPNEWPGYPGRRQSRGARHQGCGTLHSHPGTGDIRLVRIAPDRP